MKKLISIDDLKKGMFLEATVVVEKKDGEEQYFLEAKDAVGTGSLSKRARLTGRMHEGVTKAGGLLISSSGVASRLRETGLTIVSIDTDKGIDLPGDVKPLTDPSRRPPPEGRLVHFDEEIERATEIREETVANLKDALEDVVAGRGVNVQKVNEASAVMTESILRNVDASKLPMITTATLLNDVGKTRVPLEILNKPGRFEPHELPRCASTRSSAATS